MQKLKKTAEGFGLPFGENSTIYNSRLAQELGLWADSKNMGDALHLEIFKAYFVDGKNIAKISILADLALSVGLSGDEAREILETRAFKSAVDADWTLSQELQITAVPTLVMDQQRVIGAQPYEALEMLLRSNGIKRR
jgi:predicted DsbA family dithiol-disulfide isomerase